MNRIKELLHNLIMGCVMLVLVPVGIYMIEKQLREMEREEKEMEEVLPDNSTIDSDKLFCLGLFCSFPAITNISPFIK